MATVEKFSLFLVLATFKLRNSSFRYISYANRIYLALSINI